MDDKGQVNDAIFVLLTLVSIAITAVIASFVYGQINTALDNSDLQTNVSAQAYDDFNVSWSIIDGSYVFIIFGLMMALLVSSFFIPTHPIFIVINVVGFLLLIFIGAVFSNIYGDIVAQPGLNITVTQFPIITFMASKLPFIGAAMLFLSTIILYAKGRSESDFG